MISDQRRRAVAAVEHDEDQRERQQRQQADPQRRLFLRLERALELRGVALRPTRLGDDAADIGDDRGHVALAVAVAEHGDAPLRVLALDLVGTVAFLDRRQHAERHMPGRRRDQEIAEPGGRAVLVGEAHDHVEAAVALDDLRHPPAVRQRLQRLVDRGRRHPVERRALVVQMDADLRDQDLLLDLQVDQAGDAGEPFAHRLRQPAQRVEVFAVDLQRDLRPHAREHVVEPVRDRLPDIDRNRQHREARTDFGVDFFLGPRRIVRGRHPVRCCARPRRARRARRGRCGGRPSAPPALAATIRSAMKPSRCDSASDIPGLYWTVTSSVPSLNGGRKLRGSRRRRPPATVTAAATELKTPHDGRRPNAAARRCRA